jgi:hypothetical protein
MSQSTQVITCKGCKRKFPLVYTRCPYCKVKNLQKAESGNKDTGSNPLASAPPPRVAGAD